jgi:hypothetical protein
MRTFPKTRKLDGTRVQRKREFDALDWESQMPREPKLLHGAVVIRLAGKDHGGAGSLCEDIVTSRFVFVSEAELARITCPKCAVLAGIVVANKIDTRGSTMKEVREKIAQVMRESDLREPEAQRGSNC